MLDSKARPWHYLTGVLVVLGMWYLITAVTHGHQNSPIADTTVDITSMVVFSG